MVAKLRGGIHILRRSSQVQSPWLGSSEGNIFFSGLAGARLCLRNSRAPFVSWGAICILERHFHLVGSSEGGIFSGLQGALLWLRNTGAAFASWGAVSRFRVLGWEAQRAVFFRFIGRLVVFKVLRGGTCIFGHRFHMVGIPEGGIFQIQRAPGCGCGTQGRYLHLGAPFSHGWDPRGRHFSGSESA